MFCSSCGVAVAQGLSYCKYCGAKLGKENADGAKSSGLSPASLVWAMVSLFTVGLGAIIALMVVMKGADPFSVALIKAFAVLSFLLMLAAEGVCIWLLLRRNRGGTTAGDNTLLQERAAAKLGAAPERLLPNPAPSVTEHTTHTLDPVYSERKSR
jgi:hypothetical protein